MFLGANCGSLTWNERADLCRWFEITVEYGKAQKILKYYVTSQAAGHIGNFWIPR